MALEPRPWRQRIMGRVLEGRPFWGEDDRDEMGSPGGGMVYISF